MKFGGEATLTDTGSKPTTTSTAAGCSTPMRRSTRNSSDLAVLVRDPDGGRLRLEVDIYAAFAQDTWRVGSRVNLNLGLRYDFETTSVTTRTISRCFTVPKYAGIEKIIDKDRSNSEFDNFQPRLGATWNVRGAA
jgi:outer membrane receptor protein involved in Fe transport